MQDTGRRRIYLINRRYQLKYALSFFALTLFAVVTSTTLILHDVTTQIEEYIGRPTIDISSTGEIILPIVLRTSVFITLLYIAALAALTAYFLYKTRRLVTSVDEGAKSFGRGELSSLISLSDPVDFANMQNSFNEMLAACSGRVENIRKAVDGIDSELGKLASSGDGDAVPNTRKDIYSKLDDIDLIIAGIKTE